MPRASLFICLTLVVAACSGSGSPTVPTATVATQPPPAPASTTPATTPIAPTTTAPAGPFSPLNGLPVDDPDLLERRVIAVKIDNHDDARPQSGLQEADVVYELLVEGGLTRFIALFHDSDSGYLGPMRSGRPTDPTLLKPLGATFTISGAQDWVIAAINSAGVPIVGEVRPATFRINHRRAPHNLYVDTVLVRGVSDDRRYSDDPPEDDMFIWGPLPADSEMAESVLLDWSAGTKVEWVWDGTQYLRAHNGDRHTWVGRNDADTGQIAVDTLVVLFATSYTASGGSGSPVPAMDTIGTGRALVFEGGRVAEGSWFRNSIEEPFELVGTDGLPLNVPPGRIWISVFPDNREVS